MEDKEAVEQEKSSPAKQKPRDEIHEILSGMKRKKAEKEKAEKSLEDATERKKKSKKKKKKGEGPKEGAFGEQPSRPRKRTEDGLAIYTEEELGLSKSEAGGTPLCPFDCSCCF